MEYWNTVIETHQAPTGVEPMVMMMMNVDYLRLRLNLSLKYFQLALLQTLSGE